jgi:hypothetical protein
MTPSKTFLPLAVILSLMAPSAALASLHGAQITADAAMRKGIRDYARVGLGDGVVAQASRIHVTCQPVTKVGQKRPCTGTFRLTLGGRSADYTLGKSARTLRIAPHAIEYRVAATTNATVAGLPASTGGFSGFLQ